MIRSNSSVFEQPTKQQWNNMTTHYNTKNETISIDIPKFKVSDMHIVEQTRSLRKSRLIG